MHAACALKLVNIHRRKTPGAGNTCSVEGVTAGLAHEYRSINQSIKERASFAYSAWSVTSANHKRLRKLQTRRTISEVRSRATSTLLTLLLHLSMLLGRDRFLGPVQHVGSYTRCRKQDIPAVTETLFAPPGQHAFALIRAWLASIEPLFVIPPSPLPIPPADPTTRDPATPWR